MFWTWKNVARLAGTPVIVMVYYEALCPDSKHFILKQLEPAYSKASSIIDFQLIPYGKATVCELQSDKIIYDSLRM